MKTKIQIDPSAGPCFGVQKAISMAEAILQKQNDLACLGDLIHNDEEIKRLKKMGLRIVSHGQIVEQSGKQMLLRAHGEAPSTFRIAQTYGVEVFDATCPIVRKLQKLVAEACKRMADQQGQVILFGDINHPETIALKSYCQGEFYIVRAVSDLEKIDLNKPSVFFSQTTKYQSDYKKITEVFRQKQDQKKALKNSFEVVDNVCQHVAKRDHQLIEFLKDKDLLVFVSGRKSSNGKFLFDIGQKEVKKAFFISKPEELEKAWFKSAKQIAISGATSTPIWLLEKTYARIEELIQ